MENLLNLEANSYGYGFVPSEYLHGDEDEFTVRFEQLPNRGYRHLTEDEVAILAHNGNHCPDWNDVLVADPFDASVIINCRFYGLCRIGAMQRSIISFHDLALEEGVYDSVIISSDIGEHCAIHFCRFVSHYIIRPHVILHCVDELQTTNHSKFGEGVIKEGESEKVRVWLDVMNEAGGRSILPFEGINTADAYLWAKYRDRPALISRLKEFTEDRCDLRRGVYGEIGSYSVIKSCKIIKDVKFGPFCYVKGCNKLKNLTISSSEEEPSQLGEGIELVNGIVGKGCNIFYGCKAIKFVMESHSSLKYGARLIHSVLGDNSTISCCEVLNNLIFPFHEQHHNNSFLIAAVVMGQSNMAAGATIGSNHNSRGNDGEIVAGRGFWPALATSVKHDSRFASFTLLSKGSYPKELNVLLPFSLVSDNQKMGRREIMPAYWWMYNMYALQRNNTKFHKRDKRKEKPVAIISDILAPDTVNEILNAISLLEEWTGRNVMPEGKSVEEYRNVGKTLISDRNFKGKVFASGIENSDVPVRIVKPVEGYSSYHDMLLYYSMRTICDYCTAKGITNVSELLTLGNIEPWVNLGGQLVPESKVEKLICDIETGAIFSWDEIHQRYLELASEYEEDNLKLAVGVLLKLVDGEMSVDCWSSCMSKYRELTDYIHKQVVLTRNKDYDNAFRHITFSNVEERDAVLGTKIDSDPFFTPPIPELSL